jgi:hypothetical protein
VTVVEQTAERAAVAEGFAFLDDHAPGWRNRVDPDTLDIASCRRCLLGQLYGLFVDGFLALDLTRDATFRLGFDTPGDRAAAEDLTAAWKEALA